jgi:hypothetical protein
MNTQISPAGAASPGRASGAYILAVSVAGVAALATALANLGSTNLIALEAACIAAGAAEAMRVTARSGGLTFSSSVAVILAALLALGPAAAIVVAAGAALTTGFVPTVRPLRKTAFNLGLYTLAAAAAGSVSSALGGPHAALPALALIAPVASIAYFVVNWPLLCGVISLTTGRSFLETWNDDLAVTPMPLLLATVLGFLLAANYLSFGWAGAALVLLPLAGLQLTLRSLSQRQALSA